PRAPLPPAAGLPVPGFAASGTAPSGSRADAAAKAGLPLAVGEIIRRHGAEFLAARGSRVTPRQRLVLAALAGCRTARLGGHLHRGPACGAEMPLYNSCGDRHCSQCQGGARAAWLAERAGELLP